MKQANEYTGPQDFRCYFDWLKKEYGDIVVKYPPGTVVMLKDRLHDVVGYAFVGDKPTITVYDPVIHHSYEDCISNAFNICPIHDLPTAEAIDLPPKFVKMIEEDRSKSGEAVPTSAD